MIFQVITVTVDGPYRFRVTSDNGSVRFTNLRFGIQGGASFTFNLAVGVLGYRHLHRGHWPGKLTCRGYST